MTGCPMVKILPSKAGGVSLIPGRGAKIPPASEPKDQNINSGSNIVTNSVKTLKMVHIKKKKSRSFPWHLRGCRPLQNEAEHLFPGH